jgi:hypothetical protein
MFIPLRRYFSTVKYPYQIGGLNIAVDSKQHSLLWL